MERTETIFRVTISGTYGAISTGSASAVFDLNGRSITTTGLTTPGTAGTVNSLRSSLATNITPLTMSKSDALTIGTGGIIGANQSNVRSFNGGSISATGNELFVHVGGFTFNSQ